MSARGQAARQHLPRAGIEDLALPSHTIVTTTSFPQATWASSDLHTRKLPGITAGGTRDATRTPQPGESRSQ